MITKIWAKKQNNNSINLGFDALTYKNQGKI